ncbi:hypothetical protein ACFYOT_11630 [Saccharothrix saharensis]|uniref:hypothetical protein n=1 Tax=Saccharothrix saharensis TaxID=571190 RepID=UPI0036AC6A26
MATVLVWGLVGLAVLVVLWPTAAAGRRFLRRWGVPEPDDAQAARAVGYLRDRRLLYPVLFLLVPVAARALGVAHDGSPAVHHLAALLLALAVAEAVAALRPARGTRTATLTRRHWHDLVPAGAIGALLALGVLAALLAAAGLAAQPWAERVAAAVPDGGVWRSADGEVVATVSERHYAQVDRPVSLLVLVGVVAGLVAVLGVVRLAVRRRSVPDPLVDLALRRRSARVAVGIGLAWMASMVLVANNRLAFLRAVDLPWAASPPVPPWLEHTSTADFVGLVALLVGAAGWVLVANPPRRWSAA